MSSSIPNTSHGIMFHHFHRCGDEKTPGSLSSVEFEQILDKLISNYGILNPNEYIEKYISGNINSNEICLTFDDGLLSQYQTAFPILEKYNIKAFFFIYSGPMNGAPDKLELYRYFRYNYYDSIVGFYSDFLNVFNDQITEEQKIRLDKYLPHQYLKKYSFYTDQDRYFRYIRDEVINTDEYSAIMDKLFIKRNFIANNVKNLWMSNQEILSLKQAGHEIGLHSFSHPTNIDKLSLEQQTEEYCKNFLHLRDVLGGEIISASHPCGNCNSNSMQVLASLGIKVGFSANMQEAKFDPKFEIPRLDHTYI